MKMNIKTFIALLVFLLGYCYQQATAQTAKSTYTTIASSLNPSTVGASVTFTATVKYYGILFLLQPVTEGTVTFSEGATVLAANVPVAAGAASFSTTALTVGPHTITAVYNGTATYATSTGSIAQTVDDPGSCPTYAGNIAYVNASATPGSNDGTTWANAFLTLQGALDAARTCGVTQIWVAQGTYVPSTYPTGAATTQFGAGLTSADFSFHLVNDVAIYGGFSGTETQLSQRSWMQNPTILSGINARNHVVTSANDGLATRLDGFTITGGYANGNAEINVEGRFFNPRSGGGANLNSTSVTLSNLLISGNSCPSTDFSGGQGGGMDMSGGASVLTNVAFVGNSAYSGGGLSAIFTSFTMTNVVFSGNTANSSGGGMFVTASTSSPTLTNVVFENNRATRINGGADGGAMTNNGCVMTLINCTLFGNSSTGTGGTMYSVNGAKVTDKNGIYYNNSNNGNTAYNGVFNYTASGTFMDVFNATTTLSGTDPKFVNAADPDGPDNRWMTADDGLSIQSTSPAINAGTLAGAPATDIRGFARTGNPDQGAYEYGIYGPTASVLSVSGASTICRGTSTNLIVTITGGTSPYTVVYSDGTNNFTVPGYSSGADIPVSPTVNTTYSLVSVTDAGAIAGTGNSGTPTVNVYPTPNAVATPSTQTVCSGSAITTIALSGDVSGTIYNWTRDNTTAVTDIAASGSGNISGTLTNTTNAPVTVTFTITPVANDCSGTPVTATVLVNPTPNAVTTPSTQTVCSGSAITTIALSGNVTGTTYNWTRDNTASATGIATSGSGNISGTLTNTTNAPVTVTFTITPVANDCSGTPVTATVLVNPTPNAVATPSTQTVCSGSSITTIALSGNVTGATYNWTRDNTASATGIATSGSGNISGTLTNTTNAPVTVTFTITPVANDCSGTAVTATVLVNPTPNAVATPSSQTVCSGVAISTIALSGSVSGTAYNWTRDNTTSATGIATSGSGNISGTLTNTTAAPVTVTFTITPVVNNCSGTPITATVLVNPTPNAVATPSTQTVCSGSAITTIALSGDVSGTTYNWTGNNSITVTGIAASGSGNISGALTNTTNAPVTVTFTITPTVNNCSGTPITATVTVNPKPTLTCPSNITVNNTTGVCNAVVSYSSPATGTPAPTISYTFSGATTGSGSGNGSGKTFNVGTTTVTLTATNNCGTATCSFTVTVKDAQAPVINKVANPIVLLWSPSHSYQTVTTAQFITSVTDNCGSIPVGNVVITKVTSDELEDAAGNDGNTLNDIVIASNCKSVQLRSERMGTGNGRVYTIYAAVTDNGGNTTPTTFKVMVALSQNGKSAVDDITPLYTVNSSCGQPTMTVSTRVADGEGFVATSANRQISIQNYPNPFSNVTTLRYTLPADATVNLTVYNQLGQKVVLLANGTRAAGTHQVNFYGAKTGAGIYLYQLQTVDADGKTVVVSGKMVMMK